MEYAYGINDDYLDDDDDGVMYSTRNYCSDSDEETHTAFMLHQFQKKASIKGKKTHKCPGMEDDFEKDMATELRATMKRLTAPSLTSSSSSTSKDEEMKAGDEPSYYDNIYFDSDKSDSEDDGDEEPPPPPSEGGGGGVGGGGKKRKPKQRRVLTNDELLYDPLLDDEDQAWVDTNRRAYQVRGKKLVKRKGAQAYMPEPLPQSDAVLNCPACFTTLCLDCQRHEIYQNQYRAMFVFNCAVDKTESLHFAVKEDKKKKFRKNKKQKVSFEEPDDASTSTNTDPSQDSTENSFRNDDASSDSFNPVKCTICNTKVAVQDQTEVYHFFNVLTSY